MPHRVIAVVPDEIEGEQPLRELRRGSGGLPLELRVVVPAVEANVVRHTLGDIDEPRREAQERLERTLGALRAEGVRVSGEVGDPDPVQAAQDALLKEPADEVVIFEHDEGEQRWYEHGLLEHAEESLAPPLRIVSLHSGDGDGDSVVDVTELGPGLVNPYEGREIGTSYLPGLSRGDFAGMVAAIVGTITAAVLAGVAASSSGAETGAAAAAILIAIGLALVNLAHVVGLTLMESVRYRGGFARMFRTMSLIGTPLAVAINAVIAISA